MKEISDLPHEILKRCFHCLAPRDLKSCVLVSEEWRTLGEDPNLWTWCTITIRSREDLDKLSVRRLRKIRKIRIESVPEPDTRACTEGKCLEVTDGTALLQAVAAKEFPELKEICGLRNSYWKSLDIEPEVLARALIELEEVILS